MNTDDFLQEITTDYLRFIEYTGDRALLEQANESSVKSLFIKLWHMLEYMYIDFLDLKEKYPKIGEYRSHLYELCPNLKIASDIANLTKHAELSRSQSDFKEFGIHEGNPCDFTDPPYIQLIMKDGGIYNATELIKEIFEFQSKFIGICSNQMRNKK